MTFRTDNPMIDPAEVDKFYTDDAPPIRGIVKVWVKVPILVPVDAENLPDNHPGDQPIESEEDAIDYAEAYADEYVTHAIGRHADFLEPGSPLADLESDMTGIVVDFDATEFAAR